MTDGRREQPKVKRERRRSRRFKAAVRCWITGRRSALCTPLGNISRGGLSVLGQTPFEEGEEISVRIPVGRQQAELVVRSRVVWTRDSAQAGEGAGMGAEFVEIEEGHQALEQLLDDPE